MRLLAAFASLMFVLGCELQDPPKPPPKPTDLYLGHWVADVDGMELSARERAFLSALTLELKRDRTFGLEGLQGTWGLQQSKLVLRPETFGGMEFEDLAQVAEPGRRRRTPEAALKALREPRVFEILEPGKRVRGDIGGGRQLVFKKKDSS